MPCMTWMSKTISYVLYRKSSRLRLGLVLTRLISKVGYDIQLECFPRFGTHLYTRELIAIPIPEVSLPNFDLFTPDHLLPPDIVLVQHPLRVLLKFIQQADLYTIKAQHIGFPLAPPSPPNPH